MLYDVGHQDGIDYLIMECLEGETLAKRLEKGPLPLEQVLKFGAQIADALDKAHRSGVVHRDLKPGNIMLTPTGAKLLDFGLAKPSAPLGSVATLTAAAKQPTPVTEQGSVVGTFQYMSPEQVEGRELDGRSDIFSLGAVLYEMLTGQRAFEGKSQLSVASAILEKEPAPISTLKPLTPPALDHAIRRCLAKDPEERWQTARDLALELKWTAQGSAQTPVPSVATGSRAGPLARWALVLGLACLIVAALTGFAVWKLKPSPLAPVSRLVFSLPPGQRLSDLNEPAVALSPDGRQLVYVASAGGAQQLYFHSMDSFDAKPIPGTQGAAAPFFSPDSQWLGFFAEGKLKKIGIAGGGAVALCDAGTQSTYSSGSWGPNDTIVFGDGRTGLFAVPAAGGAPQPLTTLDSKKGESVHLWPAILPDAKAVLFNASPANFNPTVAQMQLAVHVTKTGERRNLLQEGGMSPRYVSTGHLLYVQGRTLMAVPFDLSGLEVKGTPVPVLEGVIQSVGMGFAQYSLSDNGVLAYIAGNAQSARRSLVWVDRKGTERPLAAPASAYRTPRISPDGKHVAVTIDELGTQVWIYDLGRETLTRLTFEGSGNGNPAWTPDGKRVAFTSETPGSLSWQPADGSGKSERLTTNVEHRQIASSWSPDGQLLAFHEMSPATSGDLWVLRLSDRKPQLFLQTPAFESAPQFSPDGRWLAYSSNESGRGEIYVQPYPGPGGKWQISTDGGAEPVWNHNGRELFYRQENKTMAVEVTTRPSFSAGKPRMLFEAPYVWTAAHLPNYDVSQDGQRFLMLKESEQQQASSQINIVLNWFEELKQKVPTGK